MIFAWLTLHALLARPAPLALAQLKLTELEQNLQQHDCSLGDLWQPGRPHFNFGKEPEEASKCLENRLNQQFGNSSSFIEGLVDQAQADGVSNRSVGQVVAHQLGLDWPTPRWPALVFLLGAMACMLTSTVAHLFGCCSEHIGKLMWRLDYAGITILIVTSFFPPVYYGFMCRPFWRNVYLGITTVVGASIPLHRPGWLAWQLHFHWLAACSYCLQSILSVPQCSQSISCYFEQDQACTPERCNAAAGIQGSLD